MIASCSLFDGDQLTYAAVKDPRYHPLFLTMCPTYAFIDRANARFNSAMGFKKDYAAILSAAWDIDVAYDQFLNNPDDTTYEALRALGLEGEMEESASESRKTLLLRLLKEKKTNKYRQRYVGDADADDIYPV